MSTYSNSNSYAAAGVDLQAGYKAVELMKKHIARTTIPGVMGQVGGFGGLFELDLTGIEPTQYGQPVANVLREDEVEPSLDRETVLRNAPDASETEFRMPRIVE